MMQENVRLAMRLALLMAVFFAGSAQAYDWDKWLTDVWQSAPTVRGRLGYNDAVRALADKVRKGWTVGAYHSPVVDPAMVVFAGAQLRINDEPVTFGAPPKNPRDLKDRVVCSWRFKLDAADVLRIRFNRCPVAVFFNKERLNSGSQGYWAALGQGGQTVAGLAGDNELIAVFPDAGQFETEPGILPESAVRRPSPDLAAKLRSVPTKDGVDVLSTILWEYTESPTADPAKLAPAYVAWAQSCDNIVRRTPDSKHPEDIATSLQHALGAMWMDNPARLINAIEREFPTWAQEATFFPDKKFKPDLARKLAQSWLLRREMDKVQEYTIRWQEMLDRLQGDNANLERFSDYLRDISGDCLDFNDYALGINLAKRGLELNTKKLGRDEKHRNVVRFNEIISKLSWLSRTAGGDIASPEAEQHFSQINDLLAGGKLEQAALQRIYSVYVSNGNLLLARGVTAISLRKALRLRLQQVPGAWEALCQYAARRVDEDSSDVLARKDLPAIERSVNELSGLVNTDKIRLNLLRAYTDRDQTAQARQQALILCGSGSKETKALAYAYLLFLENRLGVASTDRMRVPAEFLTMKVPFQGTQTTLAKLAETFFADMPQSVKARKAGTPGQVTGYIPLDGALSPAAWGDRRNYADAKNLLAQPVEPLSFAEDVVAADFSGVALYGTDGSTRWRYRYPAVVGGLNGPDNAGSMGIVSDGESLLALAPAMNGTGANLVALNRDGQVKWQSSDAPRFGKWNVCGMPYAAFGRLYSLVVDTGSKDNFVLGVSCISAANGAVLNPMPLMTMPRSFRLQNFLTGRHFTSNASGVYGWSGNGGIFGIDRETGSVDWLTSLPLKNERFRGGPEGYCGMVGDRLLTYLPEAAELVLADPLTGAVLWRRVMPDIVAFHSRGAEEQIILTASAWGRNVLLSIDPQTGDPRWSLDASALVVSGEGVVVDGLLYLPAQGGIAVFSTADGRFQKALAAEPGILKIRRDGERWYASTLGGVYLLAPDGKYAGLTNQLAAAASAQDKPPVAIPAATDIPTQKVPDQKLNLEWEMPAYRAEKSELSVYPLPGLPHLYTLNTDEFLTLISEGYYNAAGVYQPPQVLRNCYLPNRQQVGRYVASYTDAQLQVYQLPEFKTVFSFSPQSGQDGFFRSFQIKSVRIGGDSVAFRLENGTLLWGDLKTGKLKPGVFRFPADLDALDFNGRYAIIGRWDKPFTCYDLQEGGKKVWSREALGYHRAMIGDDRLLLQTKPKLELITIATGEGVTINGGLDRAPQWVAQAGDYIRLDSSKLLSLKEKKVIGGLGTILTDVSRKVFLTMDGANENRRVTLYAPKGVFELTGVPDQIRRNRWGYGEVSVGVFGEQVLAFFIEQLNIYDINTGRLLGTRRLCPDYNGRGIFLGRSLMASNPSDNFLYFFGNTKPVNGDLQVVSSVGGGAGWPRQGWAPEVKLGAANWQGGQRPDGFSMRLAADQQALYIELVAPERFSGDEYRLGVGLAGNNGVHLTDFDFSLNEAAAAADRGDAMLPADDVAVASEVAGGRRYFYITVQQPKTEGAAVTVPDVALRLDRTKTGAPVGSFVFGSAVLHNFTRFITPPADWIDCQSPANFAAREAVYSAAQSFFPQGTELLSWLRTRRVFRGCEDNIAFLEGMAKRAGNAPCAANILSGLLLEKMAFYFKNNPDVDQCSPEYQKKIADTAKELKAFADGLKIPECYSVTGLSGFTVVLYDTSSDGALMESVNLIQRTPKQLENYFFLRRNSPFVGVRGAQTLVTLPLGAGQGMELISKVEMLAFANGRYGEVNQFSPEGLKSLITAEGKAAVDVTLISSNNKESKDPSKAEGFWTGVFDAQKKLYYRSGGHNTRLRIPALVMPPAQGEKAKMTPEDIVLALKNLPSDSQLGIALVDAYREITQDKGQISVPELYKILLQRVTLRDWEVPYIVDRMRSYFQQAALNAKPVGVGEQPEQDAQPQDDVDVTLCKFLHEAGMTRGTIRQMMCEKHNLVSDPRLWRVLKPDYEKATEFSPAPSPEDSDDPVEQVFKIEDAEFRFVPDVDINKFFWGVKDTLADESTVYLLAKVQSDKSRKFFLYLMQQEQGGGWNSKGKTLEVTGWLNREKFFDTQNIPLRGKGVASVSGQLEEGENVILLRLKFANRWRLALGLGDSYGAPLTGVDVMPWEDAKAVVENPGKPVKKLDINEKMKERPKNSKKP